VEVNLIHALEEKMNGDEKVKYDTSWTLVDSFFPIQKISNSLNNIP
jgi:hypothetical protein